MGHVIPGNNNQSCEVMQDKANAITANLDIAVNEIPKKAIGANGTSKQSNVLTTEPPSTDHNTLFHYVRNKVTKPTTVS